MKDKDFYWLVGILEGEGYFGFTCKQPTVTIQSTDEDVVQRVGILINRAVIACKRNNPIHYKQVFITTIKGKPAMQLMRLLFNEMSIRRKQQITNTIKLYENRLNKLSIEREEKIDIIRLQTANVRKDKEDGISISGICKKYNFSSRTAYRRLA